MSTQSCWIFSRWCAWPVCSICQTGFAVNPSTWDYGYMLYIIFLTAADLRELFSFPKYDHKSKKYKKCNKQEIKIPKKLLFWHQQISGSSFLFPRYCHLNFCDEDVRPMQEEVFFRVSWSPALHVGICFQLKYKNIIVTMMTCMLVFSIR